MSSVPTLGYWNYRGLGEPIRYLFHYLGVKYEEKKYSFGSAPNYVDCPWYNTEKSSVGLDFPNLPYLIDGDLKITQSGVILKYLSQKYGGLYLPKGQVEELKFDMAYGHVMDIVLCYHVAAYSANFEQNRSKVEKKAREQLQALSVYMGDKEWIMGDNISHTDFLLFEGLDTLPMAFPNILDDFQNLIKFRAKFASLPKIKEFRKDSSKWPILSPLASFGGRGEIPKHYQV